jgi:hypothetical protein
MAVAGGRAALAARSPPNARLWLERHLMFKYVIAKRS